MYTKEQVRELCKNAIIVGVQLKAKGYNQTAIDTKSKEWLDKNVK